VTLETIAGRPARYPIGQIVQLLLLAALSFGFLWLVQIYANGLRDPRYLDGWVLTGGMVLQLFFHIAVKVARVSPKSAARWRKLHIFVGYLLIAAFLAHSDFSLPDTAFEWALWIGFVLVMLSGIFGTYLAWSLDAKGRVAEGVSHDRIPALRDELAEKVRAAVAEIDDFSAQFALPGLPHDAWIEDLYNAHLNAFFSGPRNFSAHLVGSQRPLKRLTGEIDKLSSYVDQKGRDRLVAIKSLVVEKDRLDFAQVYLGLTRGWQLVHVPVTYALVVLTVAHIIVAYSFSSGIW
jgi:hypothetical protein